MSHLSQKPVMNSPIYVCTEFSELQDSAFHHQYRTNPETLHIEKCSPKRQEEREFFSLTETGRQTQEKHRRSSNREILILPKQNDTSFFFLIKKQDNFISSMRKTNVFQGEKLNSLIKAPPWRGIL